MAYGNWEEAKNNKLYTSFNLLIFFLFLMLMAFSLYFSGLLIPTIIGAFAFTAFPQAVISLIAIVPVILSLTILLNFAFKIQELSKILDKAENGTQSVLSNSPFENVLFFLGISGGRGVKVSAELLIAMLPTLALSIILIIQVIPSLIAVVASATAISYGLVALFSALIAASLLVALTYNLFTLPWWIKQLYRGFVNAWQKWTSGIRFPMLRGAIVLAAGALMVCFSAAFLFPFIMYILEPVVIPVVAGFIALAITFGLTTLVMYTFFHTINLLNPEKNGSKKGKSFPKVGNPGPEEIQKGTEKSDSLKPKPPLPPVKPGKGKPSQAAKVGLANQGDEKRATGEPTPGEGDDLEEEELAQIQEDSELEASKLNLQPLLSEETKEEKNEILDPVAEEGPVLDKKALEEQYGEKFTQLYQQKLNKLQASKMESVDSELALLASSDPDNSPDFEGGSLNEDDLKKILQECQEELAVSSASLSRSP